MITTSLTIIDEFLKEPDAYVKEVLKGEFQNVNDGEKVFRNIQPRGRDEVLQLVKNMYPGYSVMFNFIRKSPEKQEEPNYIHHDAVMGDLTCILYLNENHPVEDGTTLYQEAGYEKYEVSVDVRMKYNRMFIFPSEIYHSRNLFHNFGHGDKSRLIQVLFLKKI